MLAVMMVIASGCVSIRTKAPETKRRCRRLFSLIEVLSAEGDTVTLSDDETIDLTE